MFAIRKLTKLKSLTILTAKKVLKSHQTQQMLQILNKSFYRQRSSSNDGNTFSHPSIRDTVKIFQIDKKHNMQGNTI